MEKRVIFAMGSSILLFTYTVFKLFGYGSFIFAFISYGLFAGSFIYSMIYFNTKMWVQIIQVLTLIVAIFLPPLLRTEVNFFLYKGDREEIIRMLAEGEIQKEADRYGNKGYSWYYTPPHYINATKSEMLMATVYSKDKIFAFFQSAEQPILDFRGLREGFIFSSTGEYPTAQEFNYSEYYYKEIDKHWYFVSSDEDSFNRSCLILCN